MKQMKVEAVVEYKAMYIEVADATAGGTPNPNKIGPKIEDPPNPKAPERVPPIIAAAIN